MNPNSINLVRKFLLLFVFCLSLNVVSFAQNEADTTPPRQDSVIVKKDSLAKKDTVVKRITPRDTTTRNRPVNDSNSTRVTRLPKDSLARDSGLVIKPDTTTTITGVEAEPEEDTASGITKQRYTLKGFMAVLTNHPYYNFFGKPMEIKAREKKSDSKDSLFYFMSGLLIYYGLVRLFFGKYIGNLLALFFRATMRQQQIRDQLLQSPLPSLLLNFLFLVNGGLFLTFVATYYNISPVTNRWILLPYCMALLLVIYVGKLITLKITGWIFNVTNATDTYIFIVFLVNKMIGISLLPILVVMAFADLPLFSVMLMLSYVMLVFFFGYRFLISFSPIRNEIKVNRFHFFLYLCAFEIAPLLLIYKVLLIFLDRSH